MRTYPFINTYFGSSISDEKLDEVVNIINENISAELKMIKRKRIDELRDDENYVSKMRKLPENIDASKRELFTPLKTRSSSYLLPSKLL